MTVQCQNLKTRWKSLLPCIPYSVNYQVFTGLKNWILILFILHGKEWREPVSCWVLSLCSECICKVLCWWLSWAGLQIGRNSVSTDATIVEESSACYQGLKYGSLLLKCWMHACIHANMPKFRFARLDVCLKHILCGLGLAQSVSGIRHPCQITLRVKRYSDWFLCIL